MNNTEEQTNMNEKRITYPGGKYVLFVLFCLFVFISLINQYNTKNIQVSYATLSMLLGSYSYVYFYFYSIHKRKRHLFLSIGTFIGTFATLIMYVLNAVR